MRHDALIIWGHGLPDLDGVLDLVRTTPGFRIRRILLRDIDDMPRFVRSVYNFDYAPYRHLIDKTRYLMNVPPRAAFIFLDNLEPEEHTVGKGRFAHTECKRMTAMKRTIRDRYNPKIQGKPSEHHIVHGTDHVGQTQATLKLLGFHGIDELTNKKPSILDTPDHLPPQVQWTFRKIDLSKTYARITADPEQNVPHHLIPLAQTPHALYLAGEQAAYENYWQTHRGTRLTEDHAPQAFDRLREDFDYLAQAYPDSYLLAEVLDDERVVLLDGVHRASILQSQGVEHVVAAVASKYDIAANPDSNDIETVPIDLIQLFDQTQSHDYAIMKSLPTGTPEPGSDIDILCANKADLGRQLLRNARPLIDAGYELRLRDLPEKDKTHLDILRSGAIALRLDLHEGLGAYQQVPIKPTYTQGILSRRRWDKVACPTGQLSLAVPDEVDNLVLRYLEYQEWFAVRPDKIKHAEHIIEQFTHAPALTKTFYDRLFQATNQRPAHPTLRYCDLNVKRQCIWIYWSLRDKLAWRLGNAKHLATMALTQPGLFISKLLNRINLARPRAVHHKAH